MQQQVKQAFVEGQGDEQQDDGMASTTQGEPGVSLPVSDSGNGVISGHAGQKLKYPRVLPPEVEDQVGQAVREDTPG